MKAGAYAVSGFYYITACVLASISLYRFLEKKDYAAFLMMVAIFSMQVATYHKANPKEPK